MTEPCDGCATRSHLYVRACQQCEARLWARVPPKLAQLAIAQMSAGMQVLIEQERERDALEGIHA